MQDILLLSAASVLSSALQEWVTIKAQWLEVNRHRITLSMKNRKKCRILRGASRDAVSVKRNFKSMSEMRLAEQKDRR